MPKFKRYRNKYTNDNIIHSLEDISRMSVGDMTRREKELTSQYRQIGIPTATELQNSSNVVYVNEYTRSDGTVVHAHWRSKGVNAGENSGGVSNRGIAPKQEPVIIDEEQYEVPPVVYDMDNPILDEKGNVIYPFDDDVTVIDKDGTVVYQPQQEGEYYPSTEPQKVPDGYPDGDGGGIWDKIGDIFGGDGIFGAIIGALPVLLQLVSAGGTDNVDMAAPENISLQNYNPNTSVNEGADLSPIKAQTTDEQSINSKDFVQRLANTFKGVNDKNVISNNNVIIPKETIPATNTPTYPMQTVQPVSNVTPKVLPNQQGVEFEPVEHSETIKNSLKPLSSNTEDYINNLLKTQEGKSRADLNKQVKDIIGKYQPQEVKPPTATVSENNEQKWIEPVDLKKYKITSPYSNARKDPVSGKIIRPHKGIDIAVPLNTSIKAIADGKIIVLGNDKNGWGYYVDIDHGVINGQRILSRYAHLNQFCVKYGQIIQQGQIIAKSGNTGHSTGPHLHFEILINGQQKNPLIYIKH